MERHPDIEEVLRVGAVHNLAVTLRLKNGSTLTTGIARYINKGSLCLVELKSDTLYGVPIKETVLHISEIEKASLLSVLYDDPVYVRLRDLKKKTLYKE